MKKKSQKFTSFVSRTQYVNYRDTLEIVNGFNHSVRLYKRFKSVLSGGDDQLAARKLREAGTALFQVCEWALKNYLHKRYMEMEKEGIMTPNLRQVKIDNLQARTTNLITLMDEFEENSSPAFQSLGIKLQYILSAADEVNNKPKHNAAVPDPTKYQKALNEIRKIINNYVDSNAKLDLLDDTVFGEEKAWYEIMEATSDFSDAYSYILVTMQSKELNYKGLFSLKWDLVIDFDPSTDVNGLQLMYKQTTGINPWIRMLDRVDSQKKMPISNIPYWVMANGSVDNPESIVDLHKWKNKQGKYLSTLLEKFHTDDSRPAIVIIYPVDNEKAVEKVVDSFNDAYDAGEDVEIIALSSQTDFVDIDAENFKISALSIDDFCNNIGKVFEDESLVSSFIRHEIPVYPEGTSSLDDAFFAELQDSFEVIFQDIAMSEENDALKTNRANFYRGENSISWYGIKENFDVIRKDKDRIISALSEDIKDRGRLLRHVYYEPGVGGTTLMRRVAWEFRTKCPSLILTRKNDQTAQNIQKLYDITHLPILIFADNNVIDIEEIKSLQIELKRMGFAFVICYFERKLRGQSIGKTSAITIVESFSTSEAREMQLRLNDYITDSKAKVHIQKIVDNSNSTERSPFIMSMYTFDKEFKGVKPYIANFLAKMNDSCKKIVFALALADYGNVLINIQYFVDLFDDDSVEVFLLDQTPGINELVKIEKHNRKKYLKIKYPLFAEEILLQMSVGKDAEQISFLNLVDNILTFIEDSRKSSYVVSQDNLDMLRSLFITRVADEDSEKPAFSPLITKLKEEHRTTFTGSYDVANDAIIRIFKKLVEVYPEEPHFTAHLARYYFYIDKNFEKGFENIDNAIELSETMSGTVDPLLYHMKAMGYSSMITNSFIPDISKNNRKGFTDENASLLLKMEEAADQAFVYFKKVRESNIGIAGHISEINLCIHIANLAKNMLEESEDFNVFLMSDNGEWAMKYVTRANDLWDECKELITESDNVKDIEIRLNTLTANVENSIRLWEDYVNNSEGKNRINARRILARAYEKKNKQENNTEQIQQNLRRIIELMEDNMTEESQQSGNIRIWFDAIKQLKSVDQDTIIMDALIKLNRWITLTDSLDAHYYRFVLKFIQAINGSDSAEHELPGLLRVLKSKSINRYNRTSPRHWLTRSGEGLDALVSNSRERQGAIPEEEMATEMLLLIGRISNNYVNENHAYINYRGVEVYFNPSATKGEIDSTKIHQRVKFGIGFSYDGPRAYNSSIKLLGTDDYNEVVRPLTSGMIVKCVVKKNVSYFTQVRIVGYNVDGSIHISEYSEQYSDTRRPKEGDVFDVKLLNEKYDDKRGRKIWNLTMNIKNGVSDEESISHTMADKLSKLNINFDS
mgnify:FL=1